MSKFITDLLSRTVRGFFRDPDVQREVCKIAIRCSSGGEGDFNPTITSPDVGQMIAYNGTNWVNIDPATVVPVPSLLQVTNVGNVADYIFLDHGLSTGNPSGDNDLSTVQFNGTVAQGTNTFSFFNIGSTSNSDTIRTRYPGLVAGSFLFEMNTAGTSDFDAILNVNPDQEVTFYKSPKGPDAVASDEFVTLGQLNDLVLRNTGILDFPSTLAGQSSDLTITVTGAALNDPVVLGVPNGSILSNSSYSAWVSASNTVTVRFNNYSVAPQDPTSGTFKVCVLKFS